MSCNKGCVLGMDCGTTNIKAVLLDEDGNILAESSRANIFITPAPNHREQDPERWWKSAVEIFRSIAEKAGHRAMKGLRGVCISSHTVSMLPLDENGNPLRNALTYQDARSAPQLQEILDFVGRERFIEIVGGQPSVAFLPNKLLWYRNNEPELFKKTKYFLQASSYINYKLTGVMSSDLDQASRTQCLNSQSNKWSSVIGDAIGLDLDKMLPFPVAVDSVIGVVTSKAAFETCLPQGVPVYAGCSDAMASLYATGISKMGDAGESSGTTSLVFVGSSKQSSPRAAVNTKPCAIPGIPWVFDAPIQSSGAALNWYIDKLGEPERIKAATAGVNVYDFMNKIALESTVGSGGLLFFPYLMGERAPLWNDYARGMFIGFHMESTRAELVRSIFEGTAFALRHVMDTISKEGGQAERLFVCGGGAKSHTWSKIKASMLNMPVYVLDGNSGNVPVGDALIAGCATELFENLSEGAKRCISIKTIYEPQQEWVRAYDELYPWFIKIYSDLDCNLEQLQKTVNML